MTKPHSDECRGTHGRDRWSEWRRTKESRRGNGRDRACQGAAEAHPESEAYRSPREEQKRQGVAEVHSSRRGGSSNSVRRCRHGDENRTASEELPPDDGARDRAPNRGDLIDVDVPIVTLIVQQAEQAADAADAHMSVGKMEMISRATAKMTKFCSSR